MKVNKPLFVSSITFLAILISVLIASFNIDGYTMTWPYFISQRSQSPWLQVRVLSGAQHGISFKFPTCIGF